jgi:hypothetical protein
MNIYRIVKISILSAVILITSCKKENKLPFWDMDIVGPIAHGNLTIDNFINDTLLTENQLDSSVRLYFEKNLTAVDFDTLYDFNDTALTNVFAPGFNFTANPGLIFYSQAEDFELSTTNGIALNYAKIKEGVILLDVSSDINERTIATFTIPKAKKNGVPLSITQEIPARGNKQLTIDVTGYDLDLTGTSGTEVNSISFMVQGKIADDGQATPINATDKFILKATFKDIKPAYLHGYFGQHSLNFTSTGEKINLFNKIKSGTLQIEDININLMIENAIGTDLQFNINNLTSLNNRTNTQVPLSHSLIGSTININRATEINTGNPPVQKTIKNYVIDINNSNIKNFIENLPDEISYQINININPMGNVSGNNDFFYNNYSFKTILTLDMPLSFIATELTLIDTLSTDLQLNNQSYVNDGKLLLNYENFFPFSTKFELTLLDSTYSYLGTLTNNNAVNAGILNNAFKVIQASEGTLEFPVSNNTAKQLTNTKYIVLKAVFNTSNQNNYQPVYSNYYLNVDLIADFNIQFNPNKKE